MGDGALRRRTSTENATTAGGLLLRVRPRFFDQVGHETMYASSGNKHFFTKSCHHQTYQNYEQPPQNISYFQSNFSVLKIQSFQSIQLKLVGLLIKFLIEKRWKHSTNFEIFDKVVHNFGKSDDDMI